MRHFLEHAVDAGADAEYLFVGLKVDVRGALFDGIEQDLVDEAHDRRVLDVVAAQRVGIRVFFAAGDFEVLQIEIVVGQARHHGVGLIDGLGHRRLQLVVLDHDELDAHRGLEADLVQRVQIGGIGDRQEQPLAALHQRQHAVLLHELLADGAHGVGIYRDRIQIEERHAELVRGRDGDVARTREVRGHQIGHQIEVPFLRLGDGILHGRLIEEAVLDEPLREPAEGHAGRAADRCYGVVIHGLTIIPGAIRLYFR